MSSSERNLIIDHDGGVDDVISLFLQLLSRPEKIKAITIMPADSFALPDVWVVNNILKRFKPASLPPILVGYTPKEGTHPFPNDWRNDSYTLARLPFWHDEASLMETDLKKTESAVSVISRVLEESSPKGTDILATGPLVNIADVLTEKPDLVKKIGRIFAMAGAVDVRGNVGEKGRDGSAEWNVYNDARSFDTVLRSGVDITLVSLDGTQYAPITQKFLQKIRALSSQGPHCQLVDEALRAIEHRVAPDDAFNSYFFWDTLTSLVALDPTLAKTERVRLRVVLEGPAEGRTVRVSDEKEPGAGYADVAVWADQRRFEETFLAILDGTYQSKKKTS